MYKTIPFIFVIFLAIGCMRNNKITSALDRAEAIMDEHPDSSLLLLKELPGNSFGNTSTHARYALLYSQALDKNWIDITNDSLICIASKYYIKHGTNRERFLSLFYQGRIYENAKKYILAMKCYTQAMQIDGKEISYYEQALLYAHMGNLYSHYSDLSKALEAYRYAVKFYSKAGKTSLAYFNLMDIGSTYFSMHELNQAEKCLTKALMWSIQNHYDILRTNCIQHLTLLYDAMNDCKKLQNLYENPAAITSGDSTSIICMGRAILELQKNNIKTAKQQIRQAWNNAKNIDDSINLYYQEYRTQEWAGNYKDALTNYKKMFHIQDSLVRHDLSQPLLTCQKKFFQSEAQLAKEKLKRKHLSYIVSISFLLFILVFIFLYYKIRILHNERDIENYLAIAEDLKSMLKYNSDENEQLKGTITKQNDKMKQQQKELTTKNNEIEQLNRSFESLSKELQDKQNDILHLFGEKYKLLDKLTSTFYDGKSSSSLINKAKIEIEQFGTEKGILLVEGLVNEYKDGVMEKYRQMFPHKKKREYAIMCLLFAGFSAKSICVLLNEHSYASIYMYKSRIKKSLAVLDKPEADFFVSYLS